MTTIPAPRWNQTRPRTAGFGFKCARGPWPDLQTWVLGTMALGCYLTRFIVAGLMGRIALASVCWYVEEAGVDVSISTALLDATWLSRHLGGIGLVQSDA